jgi:hypothetical protein
MQDYRRISLLGGISLGGAALLGTRAQAGILSQANHQDLSPGNGQSSTVEAFIVSDADHSRELQFLQVQPASDQGFELGRLEGDLLSGRNSTGVLEASSDASLVTWDIAPAALPAPVKSEDTAVAKSTGQNHDGASLDTIYSKLKVSGNMPGESVGLLSISEGLLAGPLVPARYLPRRELASILAK